MRYGIIGSGMMGQEHIGNINLLENTVVSAIADPDEEMRLASVNLAGPDCRSFTNHLELLEANCCDAVIIAAPNNLHYTVLDDVLSSDLPILVEKPLCTTVEDCREIYRRVSQRQTPVVVAMEYRYMPPIARLLEEIENGTLGATKTLSIREHRYPFLPKIGDWNRFNAQTGGTLIEKCCHFFDLMRLITKSEAKLIFASGGVDVNHLGERYNGQVPDILDNVFVTVDFENGMRAMLDLCMFAEGAYWQERICVTGSKAQAEARIPGPVRFTKNDEIRHSQLVIAQRSTQEEQVHDIELDETILRAGDHHGSTFYQHQKFRDLVLSGGEPEVTVHDGLLAVAMGAAATESIQRQTAIPFDASTFRI